MEQIIRLSLARHCSCSLFSDPGSQQIWMIMNNKQMKAANESCEATWLIWLESAEYTRLTYFLHCLQQRQHLVDFLFVSQVHWQEFSGQSIENNSSRSSQPSFKLLFEQWCSCLTIPVTFIFLIESFVKSLLIMN